MNTREIIKSMAFIVILASILFSLTWGVLSFIHDQKTISEYERMIDDMNRDDGRAEYFSILFDDVIEYELYDGGIYIKYLSENDTTMTFIKDVYHAEVEQEYMTGEKMVRILFEY